MTRTPWASLRECKNPAVVPSSREGPQDWLSLGSRWILTRRRLIDDAQFNVKHVFIRQIHQQIPQSRELTC